MTSLGLNALFVCTVRSVVLCATLLMALLALGACPRLYPEGSVPAQGSATHPWELQEYQAESQSVDGQPESSNSAQVSFPEKRGPVLPALDSLDTNLLPGSWLQVCWVREEKLQLSAGSASNLLELQPGGLAKFFMQSAGKPSTIQGTWRKTQPGVLDIALGGDSEMPFYGQLLDGSFLYIWNYDKQQGLWFVRLPQQASPQIGHNRFSSTRGELFFSEVVQNQFSGTLKGEDTEIQVTGYFERGVLTMQWQDPQHSSSGYAAFIVDPDWRSMHGVWWLDDYEAAPFGGIWDCTAQ